MSTSLRREMREAVEGVLRENGVTNFTATKGGKHLKYKFVRDGQERTITVAGTPSDQRSILNAMTDTRKALGVKRKVHKNPENRAAPKKKAKAAPKKMPKVTVMPDPWEKLKGIQFAQPSERRFWRRVFKWWRERRVA